MSKSYRTLFIGELVQESFLSLGGTEDSDTSVDSPFCLDGLGRPTLRGTGLAGSLIATLRRLRGGEGVPTSISGSKDGTQASVWMFFNGHQPTDIERTFRQHVAIDEQTGAAKDGALFNLETLPPGTRWPFLLEVDTGIDPNAADLARLALAQWAVGRCLIGREVARGLGWMRLEKLREYNLTADHIDDWPCSKKSDDYPLYISEKFESLARTVQPAEEAMPGWIELSGVIKAGERNDEYGIDSLSIGGHASEEYTATIDSSFLKPESIKDDSREVIFDPDFAVVTMQDTKGQRLPYIPGSSIRGPLRHATARLSNDSEDSKIRIDSLFGTESQSAKLLIKDSLPVENPESPMQLAWLQHHAEDEFTAGAYSSAKFDRVAVMQGCFEWKMIIEDATEDEKNTLKTLLRLASNGQLGIGGGQWRGHGWLVWECDDWGQLENSNAY